LREYNTIMSEEEKIDKIVESIKPYDPEKIILFGSHAWGKPNRDSDFDLMVVKDTEDKFSDRYCKVRKLLRNIDAPFDILVMTPAEIEKRQKLNDFFINDILERGKSLYEKK